MAYSLVLGPHLDHHRGICVAHLQHCAGNNCAESVSHLQCLMIIIILPFITSKISGVSS